MGAAIYRYDAGFMKLLDENHHVSRALNDLKRIVVRGRKHGNATHVDAARRRRKILGLIVLCALLAPFGRQVGSAFLSLCRQRRNPSVRRVDDH